MALTWKYKIEVSDISVFEKIEKMRNILIPDELKTFILETNAATPSKYNFMVGNIERVLGAVLSFNYEDDETDSIFTALTAINNKDLIPFGIDPFGNYICYSIETNMVVFWDHETENIESTGNNLLAFVEALY